MSRTENVVFCGPPGAGLFLYRGAPTASGARHPKPRNLRLCSLRIRNLAGDLDPLWPSLVQINNPQRGVGLASTGSPFEVNLLTRD
jgi:hypothetical protein